VRVLDGTGRPLWRVLCSAPDRKIEGRVSSDGASVLILRAAEPHSPALVSLRDASTGVVRWERRTRNAPGIVAETSPDLRSVVVGYEIRHSENEAPTGLIESYRDGRLVSSVVPDEPVQPAMLGTDSIALLDPEGWVECREWTDCAIGTERWSARGKAGSVAYSRGTTLVVYSSLDEQFDTGVTVVSVIDAFHADGTNVVHKEYTGTAPYIPTLSSDGRVLALVPRRPRYSEPPALVRLAQPERTMTLPLGVATIDFGVGNDLMLVGMVDGTLGIARVPF
jgi:hypothetical protein